MAKNRDEFSAVVTRNLKERVNGRCSNPKCKRATLGPSKELKNKSTTIGEAAHICAASPGGPRYNPDQSPEDRSSIENGIWLCASCATLIDKNGGADFSEYELRRWKRDAESSASAALHTGQGPHEATWAAHFSGICYVNVPRLAMLAAGQGIAVDFSNISNLSWFWHLGGRVAQVILQLEKVLGMLKFRSIRVEQIAGVPEDFTGATISFDSMFYTKNGVAVPGGKEPPPTVPADWRHAPHIHRKFGGMCFVAVYDPRWVTTVTAFSSFRGGKRRFAGIGMVKEIDRKENVVIVSPLVIGISKPEFDIFDEVNFARHRSV